jgi:multidrug efflux pump subunit AcrB
MWIVQLALRRRHTFIVGAILVLILGIVAIRRMSTDIFPAIDIPVVSVVWTYNGISPEEMEHYIVSTSERGMTTTVNDIEHIESQTLNGVSVIKVYFQPGAKVEAAVAQITAISQTLIRVFPPGTQPPLIIQYNAANVPVLMANVSSDKLTESDLYDQSQNFIRTQLATVQGASVLIPSGGKPRQVMVDIDPDKLLAKGLSPLDVSAAINAQNLVLPSGSAKIGDRDFTVRLNSSPEAVEAINNLPIRTVNGATVFIRDVATVRDGYAVQQNIVRCDGNRSALLPVLKSGGASTLDIVARVKAALPRIQATLPESLKIDLLADQSVFVGAAVSGVVTEAVIAACLTAIMILVFLGSWRSTLIVTISIPLSILCSIVVLWGLGETLNIMTLGGLALAVGMLVDDATVEIENIHRNLAHGKPLKQAILDGAQQVASPAFVATLSICIVFVPVFLLSGVARSLFAPLAMAVVFAMLASYLLSRTLIPTLVVYLLKNEVDMYHEDDHAPERKLSGLNRVVWGVHDRFNRQFESFRRRYGAALGWALSNRPTVIAAFLVLVIASAGLIPFLGQDFFPQVDGGQIRLHVRAPAGTRIEETEQIFSKVEAVIRKTIPDQERGMILDNIGLPYVPINLAIGDSSTVSVSDGEILVSLKEHHHPTADYVAKLRTELKRELPDCTFYFQAADIVNQILNFGLAAPIDVQVIGPPRNAAENFKLAQALSDRMSRIQGAADVHVHQIVDLPELRVNVDRTRANDLGLTQRDVANSLLISLSSSGTVAPNYWINPQNGVSYPVVVQTPQYKVDSVEAIERTPVTTGPNRPPQLLNNLATVERRASTGVINHYNVQPMYNVYASVQGRDLGGVAREVDSIVSEFQAKAPRGTTVLVRGQVQSMRASFFGLGIGLLFAIVLVYLLMVVNFQSWLDPFIILMALPGALAGILWMLYLTMTTVSVPALLGSLMCVGVATANSILLVNFANAERAHGKSSIEAALGAGITRLRPVLMTALAMILGMLPMSLGLGEGGEQNAPLGRVVIGGLIFATGATLFFVPVMYSILRRDRVPDARVEDASEPSFSTATPHLS